MMAQPIQPGPTRESQGILPVEANSGTYYGLYTYQEINGQMVCNIYTNGAGTTAQQCSDEGARLQRAAAQANQPNLGYMVVPVSTFSVGAAQDEAS